MDKHQVNAYLKPLQPEPTHLQFNGRLAMPIKCLLCDIYGTLLISGSGDIGIAKQKELEEEAVSKLVADYGIQQSPSSLRRALFKAIEREHYQKKAAGTVHPEVEIDKIWATILPFTDQEKVRSFAVLWELTVNPVWPMPGLVKLIETCRNHGIIMGIISNAQFFTPMLFEWLLDLKLEHLGFDPSLTVLSFQHGCAKPSRSLFVTAANQLHTMGVGPEQTAFIGNDMRNDIAPAKDIGFQAILFAGDARSLRLHADEADYRDIKPDLQISQLSQLTSILEKQPMKPN